MFLFCAYDTLINQISVKGTERRRRLETGCSILPRESAWMVKEAWNVAAKSKAGDW